jgi:hypothetical protein
MSNAPTGIKAHDDVVNAAEAARQSLITPTTPQATVISADVAFYRSVVRSALKNGVSPSAAMQALKGLGVTGL